MLNFFKNPSLNMLIDVMLIKKTCMASKIVGPDPSARVSDGMFERETGNYTASPQNTLA